MTRTRGSQASAAIGVLLLIAASLLENEAYAFVPLLAGIAFISISHVLTPCQDQITRWWRARVSRP